MRCALAACGILVLAAAVAPAQAQPRFADSTIATDPREVKEGDIVTFIVTLRNRGDEAAPFAELDFGLPLEALFVGLSGLPNAEIDLAAKSVTAVLALSPGQEQQFAVRMVVPRDAGGQALDPDLWLRYPHRGVQFSIGEPIPIDTATTGRGVPIGGGVRMGSIELTVLAVLGLYPLLWLVLPRRRRSHGAVTLIVIATGFLVMFAALGYRDWQTLTRWSETTCTILDKRMTVETQSSSIKSARGGRRADIASQRPLLALRYAVQGSETISTGYETGTRVSIGRGERLTAEYARWTVGRAVPCWFNPEDPRDVIVIRGFGGAYLFALLPLSLFVLGVMSVVRTRRRW